MSNTFQPSRKRPGESSGSFQGPSEHPMETEDSGDTASENENGNQKKKKKSDSNESEKTKVDIFCCPTTLVSSLVRLG